MSQLSTPSAPEAQHAASVITPALPAPGHGAAPDADLEPTRAPATFGERHGLKVLGGIGLAMFTLVIATQVGC